MLEEAIVLAAQAGDQQAFTQIYNYYALDLYKVALHTLGNPLDAEDVVSETFVESYKGLKNLRDPSKLKAWMMRILSIRCKRKIAQYIQDRKESNLEDMMYNLPVDGNMGEEISELLAVTDAMSRLSEEERHIISLAVMQGYTTREVAEFLDQPHGTVSSKLHRAIAKIRKILDVTIEQL